jgi:MFS family permease
VYGLSKVQTGAILSMIAWGLVLGAPALGLVSQKVLRSRKKTFVLCTSSLVILLLALTLFPAGLSRIALAVWFFLFSVASSAIVVMAFTTTKELFPVEMAGTSVGMVNFFPFFGGAVFQPLLGRVLDAYGKNDAGQYPVEAYRMILLVLLAASVLSLACTFLMKETYRK